MFEPMRNLLFCLSAVPAVAGLALLGWMQFIVLRGVWISAAVWLEVLSRG